MSQPLSGRRNLPNAGLPTKPTGWPIGSYDNYAQAQRSVDYLSDNQFPVEKVTIVGVDLMQVERVLGRLTWGRVLGGGVVTGLWFGFFVGLVVSIFYESALLPIIWCALAGMVFGVISAAVPYAATRGTRDFASTMQLVAGRYDVLCEPGEANRAKAMLAQLPPQ